MLRRFWALSLALALVLQSSPGFARVFRASTPAGRNVQVGAVQVQQPGAVQSIQFKAQIDASIPSSVSIEAAQETAPALSLELENGKTVVSQVSGLAQGLGQASKDQGKGSVAVSQSLDAFFDVRRSKGGETVRVDASDRGPRIVSLNTFPLNPTGIKTKAPKTPKRKGRQPAPELWNGAPAPLIFWGAIATGLVSLAFLPVLNAPAEMLMMFPEESVKAAMAFLGRWFVFFPGDVLNGGVSGILSALPQMVLSNFLHGTWEHLTTNLVTIGLIGLVVERVLGRRAFLIAAGIGIVMMPAGALLDAAFYQAAGFGISPSLTLGASGIGSALAGLFLARYLRGDLGGRASWRAILGVLFLLAVVGPFFGAVFMSEVSAAMEAGQSATGASTVVDDSAFGLKLILSMIGLSPMVILPMVSSVLKWVLVASIVFSFSKDAAFGKSAPRINVRSGTLYAFIAVMVALFLATNLLETTVAWGVDPAMLTVPGANHHLHSVPGITAFLAGLFVGRRRA